MGCPHCINTIFISKEEPRVQVGCPNCGGKVIPIGVSEEDFIRKLIDDKKISEMQMPLF